MSKLFDKWDLDEVKVEDLGLIKYICLDETLVPHTSGRHVKRQFAKSKVSIVERLMNKVMRTHLNSGKKNKAYNIVKEAFTSAAAEKFFNTAELVQLLDRHFAGKADNSRRIWTIYMFLVWYGVYFN